MTYNVFGGTLSLTQSINQLIAWMDSSSKSSVVCPVERQTFSLSLVFEALLGHGSILTSRAGTSLPAPPPFS